MRLRGQHRIGRISEDATERLLFTQVRAAAALHVGKPMQSLESPLRIIGANSVAADLRRLGDCGNECQTGVGLVRC